MTYTQCRLRRQLTEDVVWIPTEFAVVGKWLRIKDVNGWRVISRGETWTEEQLMPKHRDHIHQHEASDIEQVPNKVASEFRRYQKES